MPSPHDRPPVRSRSRDEHVRTVSRATRAIAALAVLGTATFGGLAAASTRASSTAGTATTAAKSAATSAATSATTSATTGSSSSSQSSGTSASLAAPAASPATSAQAPVVSSGGS